MKIVATVTNVGSVVHYGGDAESNLTFSILEEDPKTGGRND